jgi:hypothetical protein
VEIVFIFESPLCLRVAVLAGGIGFDANALRGILMTAVVAMAPEIMVRRVR